MKAVADAHVHTIVTDGRESPAAVVARAVAVGLRHLVITDHSTVTFGDFRSQAARRGLDVPFPGMEVSTFHGSRKYHLLLYGHGLLDADLQRHLELPLHWRNRIAAAVLDHLREQGHPVPDLGTVLARSGRDGAASTGKRMASGTALAWHLSEASDLAPSDAKEAVVRIRQRLELADEHDSGRYAKRYLPTMETIAHARARGVVAALAHPLWQCRSDSDVSMVCADIRMMREHGLRGLETRSYHSRALDDHPGLLDLRDEMELLPAGGSDYHGNGKTELGVGGLTSAQFAALAEEVAACRVP